MTSNSILLVFILTAIGNWGVPVAIYAYKFGLFKKRPVGFVGCNIWGVVMDVFIVGAINLLVFNLLQTIYPQVNIDFGLKALILGLASMVAIHIFMAVSNWQEWIMPTPWHWNEAGYWHMVSMTIQMAYVFYPAVILVDRPELLSSATVYLIAIVFLGLLFLWALSRKDTVGPW